MLPELKLKFAFPGFGRIEVSGDCVGNEETFQAVIIRFTPEQSCQDNNGILITLRRNGNCYTQEVKMLTEEEDFEGIGVA